MVWSSCVTFAFAASRAETFRNQLIKIVMSGPCKMTLLLFIGLLSFASCSVTVKETKVLG